MRIHSLAQGKHALITGASGGLGADFARQLARWGCHLTIAARSEDKLLKLKKEIQNLYDVEVNVIKTDLSKPEAAEELYKTISQNKRAVDILINNAGYALFGPFGEVELDKQVNMLNLDILSVIKLTKLFLTGMLKNNYGYILQVASNAAFQPTPLYAAYAAAKRFILDFSVALNYEIRKSGVSCSCLCPGITETGFLKASGQKKTAYQAFMMMQSPKVVQIGLKAMFKRKYFVVPGFANKFTAFSIRLVTKIFATRVAYHLMRNK